MQTRTRPAPPGAAADPGAGAAPDALSRIGAALGRAFPELRPPLSAFGRLAVTHLLMVTGDAFMTVALAGSLFFSISPSAARGRVALYLLISVAPFAVVAPALGPLLDRSRGARRAMVVASGAARVVLCLLMARDLHSLLLFPEAFLVLVASKLYLVGKAALVPATVGSGPELVRANSRLALIAGLAGLAGGLPAAAILKIPFLGAPWVLRADAVVMALATLSATRLRRPARRPATGETRPAGTGETRPAAAWRRSRWRAMPATVMAASTGMAVLRGGVGLITFLLAFELRRRHAAAWWYGLVLVASIGGSLAATLVAPALRRALREENMILGALVVVAGAGLGALQLGGRGAACLLAGALGLAAGSAKVAFDSMVQRDVEEEVRGRAFARFETRFQLAWVIGALIPVGISLSEGPGEVVVAAAAAGAAAVYVTGRRAATRASAAAATRSAV